MRRTGPSAERWSAIAQLFERALQLDEPARAEFLDRECSGDAGLRGEIERLLESHGREGAFDRLSERLPADIRSALPIEPHYGNVGPYRVLETLGEGGQGIVLLAQREGEGFQQRVAIKVLRAGVGRERDELLARFIAERGILARLEHPNIPRFLDGGVTERGEPYVAMEYVLGEALDKYCDARKLSVRQRLQLVASVCDAVQYAHRHLVVHRDLKPSNILVTATGDVKVLDFGIAKVLSEASLEKLQTGSSHRWMTPRYASPEQVRGDAVTTAADVYALGVVLYELLTGTLPHDGRSKHEVERAILEAEPKRPSESVAGHDLRSRRRELAGDLDTIVLKALHKVPERRYRTAGDLADDIRRWLSGMPILARGDSAMYRARKFIGRHKRSVAVLSVAALSVIVAAVGIAIAGYGAMRHARIAEAERVRAEEVSRFAISLFSAIDAPARAGREVSARDLLDRAADRVRRELTGQRRAAMLEVVAGGYRGLGLADEADGVAREAVSLLRLENPPQPEALAGALELHARILMSRNQPDSAVALAREALAIRRASGATASELAQTHALLGQYFHVRAVVDSAIHYTRAAVNNWPRTGDAESRVELLVALSTMLAFTDMSLAQSESLQADAVDTLARLLPADHPRLATAMESLGLTRFVRGDVQQAARDFNRVLAIRASALGTEHPEVAHTLHSLAAITEAAGDRDSAAALYVRAAAVKRKALGARHSSYARTLSSLALLELNRARYAPAETLLTRSLAIRRAALGETHLDVAWDLSLLGAAQRGRGRPESAIELQDRALTIVATLEPAHGHRVRVQLDRAATLIALARYQEARGELDRVRKALAGIDSRNAANRRREVDSLAAIVEAR